MNNEISNTLLIIAILVIYIIMFAICVYNSIKKNKKATKNENYFYIWENLNSPLQIGFLIDGRVRYNHIIGTLLKFIDKRYIKVREIYVNNKLDSYEFEKINSDIFNSEVYYELVK